MTAGYSRRPLYVKLGIKPGTVVTLLEAPRGYRATLGRLPAGARLQPRLGRTPSFVHVFCTTRAALLRRFTALARALTPDGVVWVSWPKQASGRATDLTESTVRAVGLAAGLVDVKVCAVDDTWSALKFVRRLADRPARRARLTAA